MGALDRSRTTDYGYRRKRTTRGLQRWLKRKSRQRAILPVLDPMVKATICAALLFVSLVASGQESPRVYRVPFHSINGMILLDGQVNGKPAVLLLDSTANNSLFSPEAAGVTAKLRGPSATNTTGAAGEYARGRVDLRLAERQVSPLGVVSPAKQANWGPHFL